MSVSFSGTELINIAIDIEKRGIAFYDIMASSSENEVTRAVFVYLTKMEREHVEIFQCKLDEARKYRLSEAYTKENASYFQALVDSTAFTDDMVISEMATQADSDIKALELAIYAEKDSILFYYEMKDMIPRRAKATIEKIITEEKSHLRELSELKKKLAKA